MCQMVGMLSNYNACHSVRFFVVFSTGDGRHRITGGLGGSIPLVHLVWEPHFVGVICGIAVCVSAWIGRDFFVDWAAWDQGWFGRLVMFSEAWSGLIVLLHG